MAGTLAERREFTEQRLAEFQKYLEGAESIAGGNACVYATGSFGRREGCEHSDLDLFVLGLSKPDGKRENGADGTQAEVRAFSRLDEICLKARLIEASRSTGFPEFSGDGEYLMHYPVHELVKNLGTRDDDSTNTFTARLLLLLESRPLVGHAVYEAVVRRVIERYWRNYKGHEQRFIPAYLVNDVLRLWRTFCVNYEATTEEKPEEKRAKRQLKNYKLRHSRLLTCYSGLAYLLGVFEKNGTVHVEDAIAMVQASPTERLEWLAGQVPDAGAEVSAVLELYGAFLQRTAALEEDLIGRLVRGERLSGLDQPRFGDAMFRLLRKIGDDSLLYRMMVV